MAPLDGTAMVIRWDRHGDTEYNMTDMEMPVGWYGIVMSVPWSCHEIAIGSHVTVLSLSGAPMAPYNSTAHETS